VTVVALPPYRVNHLEDTGGSITFVGEDPISRRLPPFDQRSPMTNHCGGLSSGLASPPWSRLMVVGDRGPKPQAVVHAGLLDPRTTSTGSRQ
jgi:hypothetical protein